MDFVNVLAVFVTSLQQHIEHLVAISNKLLSTIAQSVCVNYLQIANTQASFSFSNMITPGCLHKRTLSWFYRWQIAWYILLLLSYISSFVSMTHSRITCLFFFFLLLFPDSIRTGASYRIYSQTRALYQPAKFRISTGKERTKLPNAIGKSFGDGDRQTINTYKHDCK